MLTLGIETSCDETSVALVLEDNSILSNITTSSVHLHRRFGGIVPEIASRYHIQFIVRVFKDALRKANKDLGDIDLVSVTKGPGLIGALLVGVSFSKALSYSLSVPLVGVDHIKAHIYAAMMQKNRPRFPFIALVVSGGHTLLAHCIDVDKMQLLGQTTDDAAGEAFDKVAKILGLGYPGGPAIEKAAKTGKAIKLLKQNRQIRGLDFSFSGLKTAVLYYTRSLKRLDGETVRNLAFTFQCLVVEDLISKAIAACSIKQIKRLVVGGGVSANSYLRMRLMQEAKSNYIKLYLPPLELCLDNAAMVAGLGKELYKKGYSSGLKLTANASFTA